MSRRFFIAASLLLIALLFGGGGSPSPFSELVVELAAILASAVAFVDYGLRRAGVRVAVAKAAARRRRRAAGLSADPLLLLALVVFVGIPLAQLLPLPARLWHAAPGREQLLAASALVGTGEGWRPLSIAPDRTVSALLSLLPPIVMLGLVAQLSRREQLLLLGIVAAGGVLSSVLAAVQLTGGVGFILYPQSNAGQLPGLMASRNAQADLLLIALAATLSLAAALPAPTPAARWGIAGGVGAVLIVALLLSASRAGLLLLVIPFGMAALLRRSRARRLRGGRLLLGLSAFATLVGAGALLASQNDMAARSLQRFHASADPRQVALWPDAKEAARVFWPAGAGLGAFVPAFESVERLEVVDDTAPHRAHADYLEYAIEAGLPGIAFLICFLPLLIWRMVKQLDKSEAAYRPIAVFAVSSIAVILLHSAVDYPLRAMSLATLAGLSIGLLTKRLGTA